MYSHKQITMHKEKLSATHQHPSQCVSKRVNLPLNTLNNLTFLHMHKLIFVITEVYQLTGLAISLWPRSLMFLYPTRRMFLCGL